ncbi:MAG: FTR1 family iron permease [Kurthia sp.]|nr:FTR1 family iron permease [Candidatus Kurthia equi]
MKHFLTRFSSIVLIVLLLSSTFVHPTVHAEPANNYSHLYISISDAIMDSKKDDEQAAQKAIATFKKDWEDSNRASSKAADAVDAALADVEKATDKDSRLAALSELSKSVAALEKEENPVDETAERKAFLQTMTPALDKLEKAIQSKDVDAALAEYTSFNRFWTTNEKPIRTFDMGAYGHIEVQMSFLRMELANEQPNFDALQTTFDSMKQGIVDFSNNKEVGTVQKGLSLTTLTDLIDEAIVVIDAEEYSKASAKVKEFITVWPNIESDISTKNASLYTKIESNMPIIASELMKDSVDSDDMKKQLTDFKQQIQLVQDDQNYSMWDSALILLREGLEALLIILALVAFLKKSDQQHMAKWIYIGAGLGIAVSAIAAILMSTLFNSDSIASSREMIEGYVGLIAAAMMIGVGVWMHSKSNVKSWNAYIAKQMNHAMSKQSVWAMAAISFLSVFREGAETLIFYAGIAPKMSTNQFALGIVIAVVILAIVAFFLLKVSDKIPVHRFFAVATILIYLLAFKIIGVSIHTLQLTDRMSSHIISGLPVYPTIGFFPTWETLIGQLILLVLIVGTIIFKRTTKK